jgi:hypothetical protein
LNQLLTWIDQPLNSPFTHGSNFVNADSEEVGCLGRVFPVEVSGGNSFTAIGKNNLGKKRQL